MLVLQRASVDARQPVAFPPSRLGAKNKSNRQDELACGSELGVSWLGRERGEVTNRCRCSSRHRCRAVGYLALWVLGVAGYLASLHGGADLDVRVDGHLDVPISYLSLGELRWLPRLAYTVVQFERWNTAGCAISFCYSHWRILDGRHIGAARDGHSHVGFLRAISHGLDSPTWFIIERAEI